MSRHGVRRVAGRMAAAMLMAATAAGAGVTTARAEQPAGQRFAFNIPARPIPQALNEIGRVAGLSVVFRENSPIKTLGRPVRGSMTVQQALARLLAGSGLNYRFSNASTVTVLSADVTASIGGTENSGAIELDPVIVQAQSAWAPVQGYVARQSASGTKTDTPIIETPQSVTVVTKDQMVDQKVTSLADVLTYTPGVGMQSQAFSRMTDDVMLRGFDVATGNGGMLRDGMKLQSNVYDSAQEPYGLERVEVLRGASSVLYGQLAPGGVVNAISKRPTPAPLHEINLEYGSYDRKQASFDLSDALTPDGTLRYRLTGLVRDADSWVRHVPDDKVYIAPAITWQPNEATSLTLLASYQHVNTRFITPLYWNDVATGRIPRKLFLGEESFDRFVGDAYTIGYAFEHRFDETLKLRQNARYYYSDVRWDYMQAGLLPVTNGQLARRPSVRTERSYGITADTSIEKTFETGPLSHTLLAGFDYYRRSYDSHRYRGNIVPLDIDNPVYSGYPVINYAVDRGSDNLSDQFGIYLQDQIRLGNLTVLLGGRHDWSRATTLNYLTSAKSRQNDSAFTGRAGLVYRFENGIAPYVSVSQSFAPQLGLDSVSGTALKPNKGLQYEAGVRYQPEDTNLLLSAAVYELTQQNVSSFDALGDVYQIGKVRSRGVELEAHSSFGNLDLVASYAFTDSKTLQSAVASTIGRPVDLVPRHSAALWASYKFDDLGVRGLKIGGGLRYVGETYIADSIDVLGKPTHVPDYLLVDAMASYDLGVIDKRLDGASLTVNARNLFNKKFYTCAGSTGCRYGEPLTATATLSYKW